MRYFLLLLFIALSTTASHAFQIEEMPPEELTLDAIGADLKSGSFSTSRTDISVGPTGSPDALVFTRQYNSQARRIGSLGIGWSHNLDVRAVRQISQGNTVVNVLGGMSNTRFTKSGSTYSSDDANGDQLISTTVSGLEHLEYISRSGMRIKFSPIDSASCSDPQLVCNFRATLLTKTNNERLIFSYAGNGNLMSVNSSLGYNMSFVYNSSKRITSVQAVNLADTYCASAYGGQAYCNLSSWPKVTLSYSGSGNKRLASVTDTQGNTRSYNYNSGDRLTTIFKPTLISADQSITYGGSINRVSQVNRAGYGNWTYQYQSDRTTVTDPEGDSQIAFFGTGDKPLWMEDGLGRRTTFQYDANERLTKQINPEGDFVQFTYDARGNVTQTLRRAKAGSGLSDIITTAAFPSSCGISDAARCNRPLWTRDARGKQTDFTYNSSANAVATVTSPAAANGIRPQRRFSYQAFYAYVRNSSGSFTRASHPVYRLTQTAACQTASSCSGGSDEVKTIYSYGPQGGSGNTLSLRELTQDPSGLNITSKLSYDRVGNVLTSDGPLSGTSDTTYFRYDSERRQVGVILPDPDGGGALKRLATRATYDADGRVTRQDQGTVTGTSDSAWNAFATTQSQELTYTPGNQVLRAQTVSGSQVHNLTQFLYDGVGRTTCVSQRLNTAHFTGTLTLSPCNHGLEGGFGPDRITKTEYDAAGQVIKVTSAFGVPGLEQDTLTSTYTQNGQLATLKDARGNLTTYEYDGFDRLSKQRYPNKSNGSTSSTTDFEQFTYDANSNITSQRRRNGQTISFIYDGLNRLTKKDIPGTTANDVYYAYDLFGRTTSVRYGSQSGSGIINSYDKAGRVTLTNAYGRNTSYQYDAGSRRTRLTYADGFYVQYDYDTLDRVTKIRENGAASGIGVLARYSYDNDGRRANITYGNGVTTSFAYDGISRLTSLNHNLPGSSKDFTATFTYNPASQLIDRSQSNDGTYGYTGQAVGSESANFNGLNQVTSQGGKTVTHDTNGNVTGDGSSTYGYDVENKLTSVNGGSSVTFTYDPLARLRQYVAGSTTTQLLYDGLDIIAEYPSSSGSVKRRYVHGPGVDEPLVWYEGSNTSDRRFLHADERGSIVAVTNSSGTSIETKAYGPYGTPTSFSGSRFQYTGQYAIKEAGLYYYKARFYAPHLGRFLQADPIGYAAGPNLYAYVGGDPVNLVDPLGLEGCGSRIPGVNAPNCNVTFQAPRSIPTGIDSITIFDLDGSIPGSASPNGTCTIEGGQGVCRTPITITIGAGNNPFNSLFSTIAFQDNSNAFLGVTNDELSALGVNSISLDQGNNKSGFRHIMNQHSDTGAFAPKGAFDPVFLADILSFGAAIVAPTVALGTPKVQPDGRIQVRFSFPNEIGTTGTRFGAGFVNMRTRNVTLVLSNPEGTGHSFVVTAFPTK